MSGEICCMENILKNVIKLLVSFLNFRFHLVDIHPVAIKIHYLILCSLFLIYCFPIVFNITLLNAIFFLVKVILIFVCLKPIYALTYTLARARARAHAHTRTYTLLEPKLRTSWTKFSDDVSSTSLQVNRKYKVLIIVYMK